MFGDFHSKSIIPFAHVRFEIINIKHNDEYCSIFNCNKKHKNHHFFSFFFWLFNLQYNENTKICIASSANSYIGIIIKMNPVCKFVIFNPLHKYNECWFFMTSRYTLTNTAWYLFVFPGFTSTSITCNARWSWILWRSSLCSVYIWGIILHWDFSVKCTH